MKKNNFSFDDYIFFSFITKTDKQKHVFFCKNNSDFDLTKKTVNFVFVKIDKNKVPFKVNSIKNDKSKVLFFVEESLIFEDLQNYKLFVHKKTLRKIEEFENYSFKGYKVYDKDFFLGIMHDIENYKNNPQFVVKTEKNQEILIPINSNFLKTKDNNNNKLFFELPEKYY